MKYLWVFFIMAAAISLQTNSLASQSDIVLEFALPVDDYIYSSVSFVTPDCGTVTIDGWSSWSGGSCTGYCYDISSDCGNSNVSGANDPGGMLNGDGTISRRYMQAQMSSPLQY